MRQEQHDDSAVYQISGNFPRDLYGPLDTRNATWGHADADELPIQFYPPSGYRVKILRLRGDLSGAPKVPDKNAVVKGYAWSLIGFSTTANEGSVRCNYCADRCHLYIQDAYRDGEAKHLPFDWDVQMLLEPDHILVLKLASYLNQTDFPLHLEGTYNIQFTFVRSSK